FIRKPPIARILDVQASIEPDELVARINSFNQIKTLACQTDLEVTVYLKEKDNATQYPAGSAALRLERPENIRLLVNAPIAGNKVADMTSDGQKFRLAVYYPKDKSGYFFGTNSLHPTMTEEQIKENKDQRLREAGTLVNMRPQHITEAFLIDP